MDTILYEGEHLFIGNLGHFLVVLAFVSAIASGILYLFSKDNKLNKNLARGTFILHALSVFGIFITLFVIIQNHYFEYQYAYQHSSRELPMKYLVSCFWEGQEGSFLLWMVWNAVLGLLLIPFSKKWESGVMPIMALAQLVLSSMLLGIEVGDLYVIGSSPFELLRVKMIDQAPIFSRPDYLNFIQDGTGLNPLLQNYWMVIHPPTLFLGFALTIVPFAFAITGLFRKYHRGWIKPALPWALVGGMILGTGIIMGGFWAYESLSFGGYWAWDPVENASLVPWLLLIAGIHLMLIKKVTNTATIAAYILVIASFILVLYATFLTRSGVLGETSVHSFTDLGLAGQLMQFVVIFIWLPIIAVTRNNKLRWGFGIPVILFILLLPFYKTVAFYMLLSLSLGGIVWFAIALNKELSSNASEDNVWSREFWMFIGALILVLSAVQVIVTTSIPVFNKVFGLNAAPPVDPVGHYNKYQLPIAIVITILTAIGQYFHYRKTPDKKRFKRDLLIVIGAAIALTAFEAYIYPIRTPFYILFLFTCTYAVVANIWYVISHLKGRLILSGASIAHVGFGLMLIGVLVSSANKRVITQDRSGLMSGFDEQVRRENMLLMKDNPTLLGNYWVTYQGDSSHGPDVFFKVNYMSRDSQESFTLYPNAQISSNEGLMANPDTRHYITYDVYTHITSIPKPVDSTTWEKVQEYVVQPGDTIQTSNGAVFFKGMEQAEMQGDKLKDAQVFKANLVVQSISGVKEVSPMYVLMPNTYFGIREEMPEIGLRFLFEIRPDEEGAKAVLEIAEAKPQPKYIVMKAIIFPYINLLWLGTIVMVIGFGLAAVQRLK
ncbi:cytochrome c biogenesis protein CcsA [bacterium]|nr:cytochrome c biogenesis protein CcsA [bacterium]